MAQAMVMTVLSPSTKNTIVFGVPRVSRQVKCFPFQIQCSAKETDDPSISSKGELSSQKRNRVTTILISTAAVGMLLLSPVSSVGVDQQAIAASSGGRIGGQSFRSAPRAPPRAAPSPRINNSRTNVYINPPSYGYGYGNPFYGGGLSPFSYFFSPGPAVAVGGFGGLDFLPLMFGVLVIGWVSRAISKRRDDNDDF